MWNVVHRHPGQGQAHGSSSDARETVMLVPPSASRRRSVLVSWCRRMCERRAELDANSVEQCGHRSRGASSAPEDIAVVPRDSGSARLSGWGLARLKCRQRGAGWPTGRDNGAWQHPRTKAAARGWWEGVRVCGTGERRDAHKEGHPHPGGGQRLLAHGGARGRQELLVRARPVADGIRLSRVRRPRTCGCGADGTEGGGGAGRLGGASRRDETRRGGAGLGWAGFDVCAGARRASWAAATGLQEYVACRRTPPAAGVLASAQALAGGCLGPRTWAGRTRERPRGPAAVEQRDV